jgi:hypothetical protein
MQIVGNRSFCPEVKEDAGENTGLPKSRGNGETGLILQGFVVSRPPGAEFIGDEIDSHSTGCAWK